MGIYELPVAVSWMLTVFLVVFITNAINLIDGIDGLASGLSGIAMIFYGFFFLAAGQWAYSMISFASLGTLVPFFYYNVFGNPARGSQELKRARNFMKSKRRKTDFERCTLSNFSMFFEQARQAVEGMGHLSQDFDTVSSCLCHGDLDQHHILIEEKSVAVIEYHKMHLGDQMRDLYHFVRKVMEKHEWDQELGLELLTAYEPPWWRWTGTR